MTDHQQVQQRGKRSTRELILRTFARMVVEDGIHDVSIQQIADRAGITHRTIYRYFETRQELIDQLAEWLDERGAALGQIQAPIAAEDIPRAIEVNSRMFDQDADLYKALVLATWSSQRVAAAQQYRTEQFERALAPLTQHLDPAEARAIAKLIRYLASSRTWLAFREEFGLTGEESGPVVAWAVELMLDALRISAPPGTAGVSGEGKHDGESTTD